MTAENTANRLMGHVIDGNGELKDDWTATGSNNVIFRAGDMAVKVCLSLPNDYLKKSGLPERLLEATQREVLRVNDESESLRHYFGDNLLPAQAYLATANIHGRTVQKMYDDLSIGRYCELSSAVTYRNVPVMVTQQPYFSPYASPTGEAVGFYIGKGDYNHLDSPPDRQAYERLNDILLTGATPPTPLTLEAVYDVQKAESLVFYIKKIRQEPAFKAMMCAFIPNVARHTHETGAMIDILSVIPNGWLLKHRQTGLWTPKFYEMSSPPVFSDTALLNESRRSVLADPLNPAIPGQAVKYTNMVMSYMRSLNALALESDIPPPFNILCNNGDPSLPPDCELSPGGWWAVYERIQVVVDEFYTDWPKPANAGIYASVWKAASEDASVL